MAVGYGKGANKKATKLHSVYVRTRAEWQCERCGRKVGDVAPSGKLVKQMQCAHIITRHNPRTRTDENNAFCLCASCHWYFGKWPIEFARFVFSKMPEEEYDRLFEKANSDLVMDWDSEVDRLTKLISDLKEQK